MNIRIGNGYDIHRLVPGRPLILGGQTLEHPAGLGLDGHSDADVLVHAIMDALLGALSLGDIGKYFPPTDPKWKGADSLVLLEQVMGLVRERGWSVVNVDSVVIAERPKLKPHIEAMRAAIAERMGLEPEQVGVKATTNEKLGAEGREEGISCQAGAASSSRLKSAASQLMAWRAAPRLGRRCPPLCLRLPAFRWWWLSRPPGQELGPCAQQSLRASLRCGA